MDHQSQIGKELDYFFSYFNTLYEVYKDKYEQYVKDKQLQTLDNNATGIITENSRYIPIEITEKINKLIFCKKVLKDRFVNVNLRLEVFEHVKGNVHNNIKLSKYIIRVLYIVIFLCCKVHPLHGINTLKIKIVYSPLKKRVNTKTRGKCQGIATYNINSGMTTSFTESGVAEIIVYRKEEVIKVLIHELLHAFGLDSKQMSPKTESSLNAYFGLQTLKQQTLRSNESFTDSYACLLNVFIATKFVCDGVVNNMTERGIFNNLVSRELMYIINRAFKLFPVLGLEINTRTSKLVNKCNIRSEETHVISYYILKALNFVNLVAFLRYLRNNNYKSEDDGIAYVEHLLKLLKLRWSIHNIHIDITNNNFPKTINVKINKLLKRLLKIEHDERSLRMSCIDVSAI